MSLLRNNKCRRIRRYLSDGLDTPLPPRIEKRVSRHLASCSECREELAFYRDLKEAASQIETIKVPDYLWERISIELDEHPWGEDGTRQDKRESVFSLRSINTRINLAGAALSLLLLALLSLSPGGASHKTSAVYQSASHGMSPSRDIEYVSLYLLANQDRFPREVRYHYLSYMEGLNFRIDKLKSALAQYPSNYHIKDQLAMVYSEKIKLYREIGVMPGDGSSADMEDFPGGEYMKGGRYE